MNESVGMILMGVGLAIFLVGMLCFICCRSFESKLLVTSIMDGCGMLTFMLGAMFCFGFSINTLKVLLILVTVMVISTLTSHEIARLSKRRRKESVLDAFELHEEERGTGT